MARINPQEQEVANSLLSSNAAAQINSLERQLNSLSRALFSEFASPSIQDVNVHLDMMRLLAHDIEAWCVELRGHVLEKIEENV